MCRAAHSKNPISSKINRNNDNGNESKSCIPHYFCHINNIIKIHNTNQGKNRAPQADQPIDNPLGCQMTKISVIKKITDANNGHC